MQHCQAAVRIARGPRRVRFGSVLAGCGENLFEGDGGAAEELLERGVGSGELAVAGGEKHRERELGCGLGHAAGHQRRDKILILDDVPCDRLSGQVGEDRRDIVEGERLGCGEWRGGSVKSFLVGEDERGRLGEVGLGRPGDRSVLGTAMVAVFGTEPR
jgi:hypothetical protein